MTLDTLVPSPMGQRRKTDLNSMQDLNIPVLNQPYSAKSIESTDSDIHPATSCTKTTRFAKGKIAKHIATVYIKLLYPSIIVLIYS